MDSGETGISYYAGGGYYGEKGAAVDHIHFAYLGFLI
jgi:hypothetical protein